MVLISIALIYSNPLYAQKAKDKRVYIPFVALPSEKLPPDFTTYSVAVSGSNVSTSGRNESSLNQSIVMNSFARVGETKEGEFGHLRILVNTGYLTTGRLVSKSRTETYKDDKGVERKRNYYWYELPCSGATSFRIIDPEGNILASGSRTYNENVKSAEYSSSTSLSSASSDIYNGLRKNYASTMVSEIVSSAQNTLSSKFDFKFTQDDPQLYSIKKHDQEDRFEACLEKTIEVFKAMPANGDPGEYFPKLESCISFWETHASKHPGSDKDLQEVYLACNANLAYVYYYLDQFDKAEAYAKNVLKVDEKNKRAEQFLEMMTKSKDRMDLHQIYTTHYKRDLSKALPPSKVKELEEAKEELEAANNSMTGYVVMEGDTTRGVFMRPKEAEKFVFGPEGNTKFMVDKNGEMQELDVTVSKVTSFGIGDREFRRLMFSPCAKGKAPAALSIMEVLYDHQKIRLYKYYPVTGVMSEQQTEFAYQKAEEAEPVSLLDTRFLLWEKGMANYFSTCPDLSGMCSGGGIKMNEEDLVKAARVYAELCE